MPVRLSSTLNVRAERNSQRAPSGGNGLINLIVFVTTKVTKITKITKFFNLTSLCVLRALRGDFSSLYNPGWEVAFKAAIYFLRLEGLLP